MHDISAIKDIHRGERCLVLGNAPSLIETLAAIPAESLASTPVFLVNRGARVLGRVPGLASGIWAGGPYLVVSDPRTYAAYAGEIETAPVGPRFYRSDVALTHQFGRHRRARGPAPVMLPFSMEPTMADGAFQTDLPRGLRRGFTVVLDAVQIAYFMGFSEVVIAGVELAMSPERTHFYGSGAYERSRIDDMPVDGVRRSFATARRAFERSGRRLVNATPGGRLEELERVNPMDALRPLVAARAA